MKIRITSDSTCDLNNLVEERGIGILPLQVTLDDKSYYDGVNITPTDIFKFVKETGILPKTSAPSIGDYEDFFKAELESGYDCLIHFNISAKSSGSHNMAKQAAESSADLPRAALSFWARAALSLMPKFSPLLSSQHLRSASKIFRFPSAR